MKYILFVFLLLFGCDKMWAQWVQTNVLGTGLISCIAIHENKIFAGTYDGGIYLSKDNGNNWKSINNGITNTETLANGMSNASIFSIAFDNNNIIAGGYYGVYLSKDEGDSWKNIDNGLPTASVYSLEAIGGNIIVSVSGGIFLSSDNGNTWTKKSITQTTQVITKSGNNIYAGTDDGVYQSTDNGNNWTSIKNDMPSNISIYSIEVYGSTIYAGTYNGVYISNNLGANWTTVNNGLPADPWVHSIAIDGNQIYLGTSKGIFSSHINGNNWSKITNGMINPHISSLAVNGNTIYAGTSNEGMYLSTNSGGNWTPINNHLSNSKVISMASDGNIVYGGTFSQGVFFTSDDGDNWNLLSSRFSNLDVGSIITIENKIFIGTNGGCFLSSDSGHFWTQTNFCINALIRKDNKLFAGGRGMQISEDNGISWTPINNGLQKTSYYGQPQPAQINSLAIVGQNIFASSSYEGVFVSEDDGANWNYINNDLYGSGVRSLAVIGQKLFAAVDGGAGVYMLKDIHSSWQPISEGITSQLSSTKANFASSLIVVSGNLFVGTETGGIFMSSDYGESWKSINEGFNSYQVKSLSSNGKYLFASTSGGGIWRRKLSELIITNDFSVKDYPNPSSLDFIVSVPASTNEINLYNVQGEILQSIVVDGQTEFNFHVNSHGIYLIKVVTKNKTIVKKHIVIR